LQTDTLFRASEVLTTALLHLFYFSTTTVSPKFLCPVSFSSSEAAAKAKAAKRGHRLRLFLSLDADERLVSPPKRKTPGLKGMHLDCILGENSPLCALIL
tara:strand:- start:307 stop:606 length:300 start_codon:yes stop_codon:yes gene_type:complete